MRRVLMIPILYSIIKTDPNLETTGPPPALTRPPPALIGPPPDHHQTIVGPPSVHHLHPSDHRRTTVGAPPEDADRCLITYLEIVKRRQFGGSDGGGAMVRTIEGVEKSDFEPVESISEPASRFQMEMRLVSIPSQFQIDSNVSGNTNNLSALGEDRHRILAGQLGRHLQVHDATGVCSHGLLTSRFVGF
ncbi:hypothetical protein LXL04_013893 [Taraxacum kok-saghyz]